MARLSVNVNKIATLRNSRGRNNPDLLKVVRDIVAFGAEGITVHPRPDERHIKKSDVYQLAKELTVEFNIEGYPSEDFLSLIGDVKPAQCTLVPDPPEVLTSNAGWSIDENQELLAACIKKIQSFGVRVSLFVDPFKITDLDIKILKQMRTDCVELYTEAYAKSFEQKNHQEILSKYKEVAHAINSQGIKLNAGHDLDRANLSCLLRSIPYIEEVSIGHALICDSLYLGLEQTIKQYLKLVKGDTKYDSEKN